jgi:hypothetical protein
MLSPSIARHGHLIILILNFGICKKNEFLVVKLVIYPSINNPEIMYTPSVSYPEGIPKTREILDGLLSTAVKIADSHDPAFFPNDPHGMGPLDCDVGDGKVAVYRKVSGNFAREDSQTPTMKFLDELVSTIRMFGNEMGSFAWNCAAGNKETAIYHANEAQKLASSTKVTDIPSEAEKTITDRYTLAIILSMVVFITETAAKIPDQIQGFDFGPDSDPYF